MPYPNEHSLRLSKPDKFKYFRRKNNALGKGIDVIYGINQDKTEIQALRFKVDKWSIRDAKRWVEDHGFKGTWSRATMGNPVNLKLTEIDKIEQDILVDIRDYISKKVFNSVNNLNVSNEIKAGYYEEIKDDVDIYIIGRIDELLEQIYERAKKHRLRGYR